MNFLIHVPRLLRFRIAAAAIAFSFLVSLISPVTALAAAETGSVAGTITDAATKLPLPDVKITLAAPTGQYTTTTDRKGFFVLNGLQPDTYTISFESPGFDSVVEKGVTVYSNQSLDLSSTLAKSLSTIARVRSRSVGGAFQPSLSQDTYTVASSQVDTALGDPYSQSQIAVLESLPGVSLDDFGFPVLRGGRENDEGFQYDGIDFTDPFTNQFINSLALNRPGEIQLTPGAGNATEGNTGTGTINILPKRGTYPGFGSFDIEAQAFPYDHQLGFEYGVASQNGRFSDYFSYIGQRNYNQLGGYGVPAASLSSTNDNQGNIFFSGNSYLVSDNFQNNFVYKFGKDENQSLQFLTVLQNNIFNLNYGGINGLFYKSNDPFTLNFIENNTGLSQSQIQSVLGLFEHQTSITQPLNAISNINQPNATYKLQYANNLSPSTYFNVRYYKTQSVSVFDEPFATNDAFAEAESSNTQGGTRTGYATDFTTQIGSKNELQLGAKFEYLVPQFALTDPLDGLFLSSGFGNGFDTASFLSPSDPACPLGAGYCGYLSQFFPKGVPKVPEFTTDPMLRRQDYSLYADDTITPSTKLKIDAGLRLDMSHFDYPPVSSGLYAPGVTSLDPATVTPSEFEPRLSFSYQLGPRDAIRGSYGRSVELPFISQVDDEVPMSAYAAFSKIPSYDAAGASAAGVAPGIAFPAMWCGTSGTQLCNNFAQQIYWNYVNNFGGIPLQPAKAETFNNFDFSYSHQFSGGLSFKVTPFYRRGYDVVALTATPKIVDGAEVLNAEGVPALNPFVTTNLGVSHTTGVEFYLTKESAYGLSGQVSATYLNESTNVVPLSGSEDFFPAIPPASLELGNQYRVGFVSPFEATAALQYKFHNGLKINPQIYYIRGYPYNPGTLTAAFVNGVPVNVPNTNVTSPNGPNGSGQYVDPQNPGSQLNPNIAATRGTPDTPSAGGLLTPGQVFANLDLEYTRPGSRSTVGVQFFNLFNNLASLQASVIPSLNPFYQPVATGVAGKQTGSSGLPVEFPGEGFSSLGPSVLGGSPYNITPNGSPFTILFYYRYTL